MSADPSDPKAEVAFSLKTRRAVSEDAAPAGDATVGEDELLTDGDKKAKTAAAKGGALDCTTRRRACKNCVCGRAELEAKLEAAGTLPEDGAADMDGPPVGGCGGCSKGDAFRCATCPYRGQPAWTATTSATTGAVQLNLTDDI